MVKDIEEKEKVFNAPQDNIPAEVLPMKIKKKEISFDRDPSLGAYPEDFPIKEAIVQQFHKALTDPLASH